MTGESPELRELLPARVETLPPDEFWALWWALRYLCFFVEREPSAREARYGPG